MSSNLAIYGYLSEMNRRDATDLYITVNSPPMLRIKDRLEPLMDISLTEENIEAMLSEVLTSRQRREFDTNLELNLALDMGPQGRFRVNVLKQRQRPALVIRRIISEIPSFEELHLPQMMENLATAKRGLVLVTGMTSSGKSTSLAAMVNYRNANTEGHIITIEDPIEYYHTHKKSLVTQREVGIDTSSFNIAMKNALRQKPDVILVGEIRDAEVMEQVLTAAGTGHLVFATIHTTNASQAIERILHLFPEERHNQIRISLSMNLRSIVAQRLVKARDGGQIVALEVLMNEALIKELILKGEIQKIRDVMAQNATAGMRVFDQSLLELYIQGKIDEQTAIAEADLSADMKMRIQQFKLSNPAEGLPQIDTSRLSL